MTKDKNKNRERSKEPFPADYTPEPPQEKDPRTQPTGGGQMKTEQETSASKQGEQNTKQQPKKTEEKAEGKKKLLGESPMEIDDETTI